MLLSALRVRLVDGEGAQHMVHQAALLEKTSITHAAASAVLSLYYAPTLTRLPCLIFVPLSFPAAGREQLPHIPGCHCHRERSGKQL